MKNTGTCPKCGSTDLLLVAGTVGPYGSGNNIRPEGSIFSAIKVHRYLCCDCGFSEEWIDKEDIPTLKEVYPAPKDYVKPKPFRIF